MRALTGSPAAAGVVAFAFTLPMVLVTLPAGAILDRVNRKWAMIACEVRGLAAASVVVALWAGWLTFVQLVVVSVVRGAAFPFFLVGERAVVRHLVAGPQLAAGMARVSAREFTGLVAGQSLGGALFGLGRPLPFIADTLGYAASLVSLLLVRAPFQDERLAPRRHLLVELREGLAWTLRHPLLRGTALLGAGLDFVANALYLAVIVAAQRCGAPPAQIGVLLGFMGVAGVAGSLVATRLANALSLRTVAVLTLGTWTLLTPALAVAPSPLVIGLIYGAMFVLVSTWAAALGARQQQVVPEPLTSRVQSAVMFFTLGAVPLAQLGVGLGLQTLGLTSTVLLLSGILLATFAGALLNSGLANKPPTGTNPNTTA